jgi:antitoxin (DNA-binding transcriptional repressor) of toxin-antitoxin stability system
MTHIDIEQAKVRFAELLELAAGGQEVVIDKDQQPFVRLSPASSARPPREFGSARGLIQIMPDFDEPLAISEIMTAKLR